MDIEQLLAALRNNGLTVHKKLEQSWLFQDRDSEIVALPNPQIVPFSERAKEFDRWIARSVM